MADVTFVNNGTYTIPKPSVYVTVITTILNATVVPINMFTIFVIFSSPRCLAKAQYRFLACLSFADMLSGFPFYLRLSVVQPLCNTLDLATGYHFYLIDGTFQCVSLWTITLMSMDHYLAICKPLTYHKTMTPSIANRSAFTVWLVCILISNMPLIIPAVASLISGVSLCDNSMRVFYWAGLYLLVVFYFLPIALIVVFYIRVYVEVFRFHRVRDSTRDSDREAQVRSVLKSVKTCFMMLGGFAIFWFPIIFVGVFLVTSSGPQVVYDLARLWLLLNSLYDPFIYGVRIPEIRQGYKTAWDKLRNGFRSIMNVGT